MTSPCHADGDDPFGHRPAAAQFRVDSADYELLWPRELLLRELSELRTITSRADRVPKVELLLEEAFLGEAPVQDYRDADAHHGFGAAESRRFHYLAALLAEVPRLREHRAPSPYWSARRGGEDRRRARGMAELRSGFARVISTLIAEGYFDRALPKRCVDDPDSVDVDPNEVLADRLGVSDLWPLTPDTWDDDTFYDLIEVFHDLAARPRTRTWHSWDSCGWHFGDFGTDIGRALYRWRINQHLESAGIALRLADDGEDVGRLVRVVDDARTDLLDRTLSTSTPDIHGRVEHAIALYRARDATEHHKRSATITLAGILEERRDLIRSDIGRKDEGALFSLANEFAIRHQRRGQHGDYDPAFLDWIFWWYLATIELTDRILARDALHPPPRS